MNLGVKNSDLEIRPTLIEEMMRRSEQANKEMGLE